MKLNKETLDRVVVRRMSEYDRFSSIGGMSTEEIMSIASRMKRKRISPEDMKQIGFEAEECFVERLRIMNPELLSLYHCLKNRTFMGDEAKEGWRMIQESIDEKGIKQEYIDGKLALTSSDRELVYDAVKKITERAMMQRLKSLKGKMGSSAASFVLDLESRTNQINYPNAFEQSLVSSFREDSPVSFNYLFCLRYRHVNGEFGVSDNLDAFSYADASGKTQRRDGSAKRFQLDSVLELNEKSRGLENVSHNILVMDTDLDCFLVANQDHREIVQGYIDSIRSYTNGRLNIIPASAYFGSLGFSESECMDLVQRIQDGEREIIDEDMFTQLSEKNLRKVSRSLRWDDEQNSFYTASLLARNALFGKALSHAQNFSVNGVFNKNAFIGSQFNLLSDNPVVFMALPIYGDNVGGMGYA